MGCRGSTRSASAPAIPGVGFLLGDGCEAFASGVFKTTDAGKHWEPVAGPRTASWFAGEFQNEANGVLCGAWSRLANFEQNVFNVADTDRLDGRRALLGLQVLPQKILAVGQGGLILSSVSGGKKWGEVDAEAAAGVAGQSRFSRHAAAWAPGSGSRAGRGRSSWPATIRARPGNGSGPVKPCRFMVCSSSTSAAGRSARRARFSTQRTAARPGPSSGRAANGPRSCASTPCPKSLTWIRSPDSAPKKAIFRVALRCTVPAAGSNFRHATAAQRFAAGTRLAGGLTGETLWQFPLPQYLAGLRQATRPFVLERHARRRSGPADLAATGAGPAHVAAQRGHRRRSARADQRQPGIVPDVRGPRRRPSCRPPIRRRFPNRSSNWACSPGAYLGTLPAGTGRRPTSCWTPTASATALKAATAILPGGPAGCWRRIRCRQPGQVAAGKMLSPARQRPGRGRAEAAFAGRVSPGHRGGAAGAAAHHGCRRGHEEGAVAEQFRAAG